VKLRRHRFDDDHVIDRLPAATALPAPGPYGQQDLWYYCAGHLTHEVILANVQNQSDGFFWHALVKRSPMSLSGCPTPPRHCPADATIQPPPSLDGLHPTRDVDVRQSDHYPRR
jgi:hypothetical protein